MRILLTGAGGAIGNRLLQKILPMIENSDVEYLIAIDREGVEPLFEDDSSKKWINFNLDEATIDDWNSWVIDENISRVYYIESLENLNLFIPIDDTNERLIQSDDRFLNFLNSIYTNDQSIELEVVYLSTDKLYKNDEFPQEFHDIKIKQPIEETTEEDDLLMVYTNNKISSEMRLLTLRHIESRIIRPFAIVSTENDTDYPLTSTILKAMFDIDLEIYQDGQQGLAFTHVLDLVNFLMEPKLFDPMIKQLLSGPIINFSRVWNYLSEYLLINKIRNKVDSKSIIVPNSDIQVFKDIMRTPQIRNMSRIYIPSITIEEIIEEIAYARTPQNTYEPLVIEQVYYTNGPILHINGTGEPEASIVVYLGTGEMLTTNVLENGVWEVVTEEPYVTEGGFEAEVRITSKEGIQYQTERVLIPSSIDWTPPNYQDLNVTLIRFRFTEGSAPKPYLEIGGTFDPAGNVKITLPANINTNAGKIYLEAEADEHGNWYTKTLPGYYITEEGHEGIIKAYLSNGTLYSTFTFEVPVSGITPPPAPQPEPGILEVSGVDYKNETQTPFRQYLEVYGKAEANALIEIRIPGASGSNKPQEILGAVADLSGDWITQSTIPYYMAEENQKGKVYAFNETNTLYAITEFNLPISPEAPPPPPEPHPFIVGEITYVFDAQERTYLHIKGEGPAGGNVQVFIDDRFMEATVDQNNFWEVETSDPFTNYDMNDYGTAKLYVNELFMDQVDFILPVSPAAPTKPLNLPEIKVTKVEHRQEGLPTYQTNYLYLEGYGEPNSEVKVRIPRPNVRGVIEYMVKCDDSGKFKCQTYKGYAPKYTGTGVCEGYAPNSGEFYNACTCRIPPCPRFSPF